MRISLQPKSSRSHLPEFVHRWHRGSWSCIGDRFSVEFCQRLGDSPREAFSSFFIAGIVGVGLALVTAFLWSSVSVLATPQALQGLTSEHTFVSEVS